jgi:hypothetical protein
MYRYFPLCLAVTICLVLFGQVPVRAEMKTAYIVANDETFRNLTGLCDYLKNGEIDVVQVKPTELDKVKGLEHYLVFGNPDDGDAIGKLITASLTPKQLENAKRMGKTEVVIAPVDGANVMFFASSYSMKTFVQGSAAIWKEYFEGWYGIPLSVSQVIGY